ncbi:hypothetical protein D9M71_515350 [compost metagenome]
MRSAASFIGTSAEMIAGDLPPSSRVTGVRLSAAARITCLPMLVAPVNSRWSKGSLEKATPTSTSPSTTATRSSGKTLARISLSAWAVAGVDSLILTITRLPAASAATIGLMARNSG